ncbi:MAG: HAD family hydrolase [Lachnospiraceae bacterium]
MKKAVIFDLDGTLLNTLEDLRTAVNLALRAKEYPERTLEQIRLAVGNGIRKLISRSVPAGTGPEEEEQIFQRFREEYQLHCSDTTAPYDGVTKLLHRLRTEGCLLAVVSNKADFAVQELVQQYFPGCFDAALGETEGFARKPAPDMVEEVLRRLGVEKKNAVYVGDSEVDIVTARNTGLFCISVTWGFRDRNVLTEYGAECFAKDTEELYAAVAERLGNAVCPAED